jgi:hypothetical protein
MTAWADDVPVPAPVRGRGRTGDGTISGRRRSHPAGPHAPSPPRHTRASSGAAPCTGAPAALQVERGAVVGAPCPAGADATMLVFVTERNSPVIGAQLQFADVAGISGALRAVDERVAFDIRDTPDLAHVSVEELEVQTNVGAGRRNPDEFKDVLGTVFVAVGGPVLEALLVDACERVEIGRLRPCGRGRRNASASNRAGSMERPCINPDPPATLSMARCRSVDFGRDRVSNSAREPPHTWWAPSSNTLFGSSAF